MFPPYLFAYAETLRAEPAVERLFDLARERGARLWVTGGTLRDVLLTRWPRDLDLAVDGDVEALGRGLARRARGRFVPLDAATGTARVAIRSRQGIDWIDLVALRAPTIEDDLRARDFTVNAIALPLEALMGPEPCPFLDPTGGRDDLHGRHIRMTSAAALDDDPLRLVRAYRFAAQLGFAIDPATREAIAARADLAVRPAAERVHQELSRLLACPTPADALEQMMADGVLGCLCPELAGTVGVAQDHYHHLPVWEHTLETVRGLGALLQGPGALGEAATAWAREPAHAEVLTWAALFHDVGKPATRTPAEGRTRFPGHEDEGAELFAAAARRLRLPGRKARRAGRLIRNHLRPLHLLPPFREGKLTLRAVDRLCREMEDDLSGLFLLALADTRAARGPAREADTEKMLAELYGHVESVRETRIRPLDARPPLLTGTDLIRRFGVPRGPRVGALLEGLREARLTGAIATRAEADAWVRARLAEDDAPRGPGPVGDPARHPVGEDGPVG